MTRPAPIEPVEGLRLHPLAIVLRDWRTWVFVATTLALATGWLIIVPSN